MDVGEVVDFGGGRAGWLKCRIILVTLVAVKLATCYLLLYVSDPKGIDDSTRIGRSRTTTSTYSQFPSSQILSSAVLDTRNQIYFQL